VTTQINFSRILLLIDETQKWKYFTQKFQIISQEKKKNPPVKGDGRLFFLEFTLSSGNSYINSFLAQNLFHLDFARGSLMNNRARPLSENILVSS
jgi:hypothetical protein